VSSFTCEYCRTPQTLIADEDGYVTCIHCEHTVPMDVYVGSEAFLCPRCGESQPIGSELEHENAHDALDREAATWKNTDNRWATLLSDERRDVRKAWLDELKDEAQR
jgi:predicted RNA-binding Zn-ribbon protein involved in translation (DUF1610 family)